MLKEHQTKLESIKLLKEHNVTCYLYAEYLRQHAHASSVLFADQELLLANIFHPRFYVELFFDKAKYLNKKVLIYI